MKNKRQFAFCTKRTVFVALFLVGVLISSAVTTFILNVKAAEVPVPFIEFSSEHSNYQNEEMGSWKVKKSAEWIDAGKARVTFEVNSISKFDNSKKLDIVMVIDNSGSMTGDKMQQVKSDAASLVDSLLADADNKIALISFDSYADIHSGLTNNKQLLLNYINDLPIAGSTNYYDALLKAETVLSDYSQQDGRELILLFLTDGYPNIDVPNEIAQYQTLKTQHPYLTINGIQYEMGDTVLQPIIDISDHQFIADMSSLRNVLFEATAVPDMYDEFTITDYIEGTYWTVANADAIEVSNGTASLENSSAEPKITWTMDGSYRSGKTMTMTIDIDLRPEFYDVSDLLLPTNTHETVKSSADGVPNEDVNSSLTPILKDSYNVTYDPNLPSGCDAPTGTVPDDESHTIFSTVEIHDNVLTCSGYIFKGWYADVSGIYRINDDYFRMPGNDVHVIAMWGKPDISKSLDGVIHQHAVATLEFGSTFNSKLKVLSGQDGASTQTDNYTITRFERSYVLSPSVDKNDAKYKVSTWSSDTPVYAWFDNGIIYYYSEADEIFLNSDARFQFDRLRALTSLDGLKYVQTSRTENLLKTFSEMDSLVDISALKNWDTSNVTNMQYLFDDCPSLTNVDALANWDTSSVTNMSGAFSSTDNLANIDGLANWNTSNVTDMSAIFYASKSLTNIDALSRWDMSNVTDMRMMFSGANNLEDACGASGWNVGNATDMTSLFGAANLTSVSCLNRWNTSNVRSFNSLLSYNENLYDISGLSTWNTDSLTSVESMLSNNNALKNIDALANWNMSNVTNMNYMFSHAKALENINGALRWNTGNVTKMNRMFYYTSKLTNIDGAAGWNTENVVDMQSMFSWSGIINIDALATWKTGSVTNMSGMFTTARSLKNMNGALNWDTSSVTTMTNMFGGTYALTDISGLAKWKVGSVKNMYGMFSNSGISNIDALLDWDVSNVTSLSNMFYGCSNLTNVSGARKWKTLSLTSVSYIFYMDSALTDISGVAEWDTSKLTDIAYAFLNTGITNVDALADWDVSKITNMNQLFSSAKLTNIDGLLDWDVSNVTDMSSMFLGVTTLRNVNGARKWVTSNVTNMSGMFNAYNLEGALNDISGLANWDTSNVTNMKSMFRGDVNLTSLSDLNGWVVSNVTDMTEMFDRIPATVTRPTWYVEQP